MKAMILAGGMGTRLFPYTTVLPKPIMPIGEYSIIEIIIRQLKYYGFDDITISLGYLGDIVKAYLQDGGKFGVRINYVTEDEPLGTAGPLKKLSLCQLNKPILLMNGDILSDINYKELYEYHIKNKADFTIAAYNKEYKLQLGYLKTESNKVIDYIEKPVNNYTISMGIYILEPYVISVVEKYCRMDVPDLVKELINKNMKVLTYDFNKYWLDLGTHLEYQKATDEFEKYKDVLIKKE
jgi:NDP-sugar pyrophosphorylase family protein